MRLIEKIASVIAPDSCLVCGEEGSLFCESCRLSEIPLLGSSCFRCGAVSADYSTCQKCLRKFPLKHVWVVARYDSWAKELVHELKFEHRRSAAIPMARLMESILPILDDYLITWLSTSPQHMRMRGFDQAKLVSKELARGLLPFAPTLRRIHKVHQIGSSQAQRQRQLKGAFIPINKFLIKNSKILIIDDVATTGASLSEVARTLNKAGAKEVSAVVFART